MNQVTISRPGTLQAQLTVAVADDMPEIRSLAREWLTAAGHKVVCACNGAELLQIVRHQAVDLVITDVMMPDTDGFEVIRALRRSHPDVRIVTISGGAPVMSMGDCLKVAQALGAHAVLPKPFTRKQLFATVTACLHTADGRS